ncbi:MAG TPA: TraB/GumN family protein [Rhizomicrobium sp.]
MSQSFLARARPLALALAAAALSLAAATAPINDWSNIETVVVTAKVPGPALWHVASGTSEVWILATVSPVPKTLPWDQHGIASLLKGSNALLLPPNASVGIAEGLWFYMWHMDTLEQPDGTTLEATLPEPLRSRFVAARGRAHQDADRYDKYLPAVAALILENDFQKSIAFTNREPQKTVELLAAEAGVPVRHIATYPAMDVIHDVPNMSAAANRACMEFALSDIDTIAAHGAAAAQAWTTGDMDGVKANYSETRLDACLAQSSAYAALRERGIRDEVAAIVDALKKPGKTFVVMPMGFFLRKNGVLDRLEAGGLTVSGP